MIKAASYFHFCKKNFYFDFDFVLWYLITLDVSLEPLSSSKFGFHLTFSPKKYPGSTFGTLEL